MARRRLARRALRNPIAAAFARLRRGCGADPRAGHRFHYGDLQRGRYHPAAAASLRRRRSPRPRRRERPVRGGRTSTGTARRDVSGISRVARAQPDAGRRLCVRAGRNGRADGPGAIAPVGRTDVGQRVQSARRPRDGRSRARPRRRVEPERGRAQLRHVAAALSRRARRGGNGARVPSRLQRELHAGARASAPDDDCWRDATGLRVADRSDGLLYALCHRRVEAVSTCVRVCRSQSPPTKPTSSAARSGRRGPPTRLG